MTKKNRQKRKKKSESDDEQNVFKYSKCSQSPGDKNESIRISEVLNKANSVLYSDEHEENETSQVNVTVNNSFSVLEDLTENPEQQNMASNTTNTNTMETGKKDEIAAKSDQSDKKGNSNKTEGKGEKCNAASGPTNSDIVAMLSKIELRLADMDSRLETLNSLEKKVDGFDKELKKLWGHIDRISTASEERFDRAEGRVFTVEMDTAAATKRIEQLEKERQNLQDSVTYLQSQSMRNNLIFGNIDEEANEKPERTEQILRTFLVNKLNLSQELVDNIKTERVHRMGPPGNHRGTNDRRPRRIVCKFNMFTDREMVRKLSHKLRGTNAYITEQFPPEVTAKRRVLVKRMKEEKAKGHSAWISYDTLYLNGNPVRDS